MRLLRGRRHPVPEKQSAGGCARKLEACARDLKEKESGLLGSPGEAN